MHLSTTLPDFQAGQIIYLQHEATRLYAEAIQVVKPRQLCWARPLALLKPEPESILHDLRQGSDLLLPLSLFFIALDIEAIPVIMQLNTPKAELEQREENSAHRLAHLLLQDFIRQIWQAHPDQFST
jgi:hypothetical protein